MTTGGRLGGWILSAALAAGLAALSRGSWRAHPGTDGAVRLTLSARPERIETCRRLTAAELADRPVHMRQEVVCQGATASYRLRIWRGDDLLDEEVLHGSGMRHDRPLYVLRDYDLPPGTHRIRVAMQRVEAAVQDTITAAADTGLSMDRGVREAEERQRRRLEAIPAELSLDETVTIAPRQVVLVTWDAETRRLRIIR